jgi:hypothetical protein
MLRRHTSRTTLLAVLLSALLLFAFAPAAAVDAAVRARTRSHRTHHYAPKVADHPDLPHHTHDDHRDEIKCNSCKALSQEIFERLEALFKLRHDKPKHYETVEVFERMCVDVRKEYGLLMRDNKPTWEFSRRTDVARMQGDWIGPYFEGRCGQLLAAHEEQIVEKFRHHRDLTVMQNFLCKKMDHSCKDVEFQPRPNADL